MVELPDDLRETRSTQGEPLDARRLTFDATCERLTHYLFRYPAKFHPPVVRALLQSYTQPGDRILDPFCGSGSLLVEAAVAGRHAVGSDVDPVAVFVSRVKTKVLDIPLLAKSCEQLRQAMDPLRRLDREYQQFKFDDLLPADVHQAVRQEGLWVPEIPNLFHWFRCHVVLDLARMYQQITRLDVPEDQHDFFRLCFASIIRTVSNADPVPVSGLEVTSYMKKKEKEGRVINPFDLLEKATKRAIAAAATYAQKVDRKTEISVLAADAMQIASRLDTSVDAVITSPPYHNAVDYYRRHQLEMFWLGLTPTQADRLALLPRYIGRSKVPGHHPLLRNDQALPPLTSHWEARMQAVSPERTRAFRHYVVAMRKVFEQLAHVIKPGGDALFVVGHSSWNGSQIPTKDLFVELAGNGFGLVEQLWYPIVNRYMSYARHNGASIDREYVLVFRRVASPVAPETQTLARPEA